MIRLYLTGAKSPYPINKRIIRSFNFGGKNVISTGTMSEVFLQQTGDRSIAVKTAPLDVPHGSFFIRNEARILQILDHPNIPRFYTSWERGRKAFLAMEYFEGRNVDSIVHSAASAAPRRLRLAEAIFITLQVAEALAYMHGRGIVHVDIKPQNILYNRPKVKLVDFAFARPAGGWLDVERNPPETNVFGTNGYLSVDRIAGKPPREADDIFALGVSLYEMLTGETAIAENKLTQDMINFGRKVDAYNMPEPVKKMIFRMTGLARESTATLGNGLQNGRELLNYLKIEIPRII